MTQCDVCGFERTQVHGPDGKPQTATLRRIEPCLNCGAYPCFDCGLYTENAKPFGERGFFLCDTHSEERQGDQWVS